MIAARQVLVEADELYRRTGAELDGFLSERSGFLPRDRVELALPESHRAWDQIAAELPELWREVSVRAAVEQMPPLRATEQELPARYVRRASIILSILAHSYVRSETEPAGALPGVLERPWRDVAARLGKPEPYMWYEDLVLGNWRLADPAAAIVLEQLEQLVPTPLGIQTERVFYLVQVEMHARAAPLIGAVVRAQEAVVTGDEEQLENELLRMIDVVREVHEEAFLKIDPNLHSPTTVDPGLWGGFVAPFAVSLKDHIPGPGGTAAPLFHLLDAFLERGSYQSPIGIEALRLRETGPRAFRDFTAAVASGPGTELIVTRGSRRVRGLLRTLLDVYAGPGGLLEAHRLKAYGFLETAFKVGRAVTISGLSGGFHERPWRKVHNELGLARAEREHNSVHDFRGVLRARSPAGDGEGCLVTLDVDGQGIVYRPGDRCLVWPRNRDELVRRTLSALDADGSEAVSLSPEWVDMIRRRTGDAITEMRLDRLLALAALQPLPRVTARRLQEIGASSSLRALLEDREEHELDLAAALSLLRDEGFDVRTLLDGLASILPPCEGRQYGIASVGNGSAVASTIELLVEPLELGVASSYLREGASLGDEIPLEIVRPPRFHLPSDEVVPLVIYTQASGIASIIALLRARSTARSPGPCTVVAEAAALPLIEAFSACPWLTIETASASPKLVRALAEPERATLYISGRDTFVHTTIAALDSIRPGLVEELVGQRRGMFQVLPTLAPQRGPGVYDVSELALHNDDEHGWWLALENAVYDMTRFRELHPGGSHIVDGSAGTDASREYGGVLHYRDPEISAMLAMYSVGELRRLDLGEPSANGLRDLYAQWVQALYTIVEMQNAFENDIRYLGCATTSADATGALTPFKLMMFANSHRRFVEIYYKGVTGELLGELGRQTAALIGGATADQHRAHPAALGKTDEHLTGAWREARAGGGSADWWAEASALVDWVKGCDRRLLGELKAAVRAGVQQFERHERAVLECGGELLEPLHRVPDVLDAYHRELEEAPAMVRAG